MKTDAHMHSSFSYDAEVCPKKMIEASLRTIILADSSKFGRRGFGKICDLNRVDVIITDSGISKAMAQSIEEIGIELIIV